MDPQDFKDSVHARLIEHSHWEGDCWIWDGACRRGYPVCKVGGRVVPVARVAFWVYRGDSERFDVFRDPRRVEHVGCCRRRCVRFEHLAAVERKRITLAVGGRKVAA